MFLWNICNCFWFKFKLKHNTPRIISNNSTRRLGDELSKEVLEFMIHKQIETNSNVLYYISATVNNIRVNNTQCNDTLSAKFQSCLFVYCSRSSNVRLSTFEFNRFRAMWEIIKGIRRRHCVIHTGECHLYCNGPRLMHMNLNIDISLENRACNDADNSA